MIVVDLDGTILNNKRELSVTTEVYLKKLKEKGYMITIATGRIYRSALKATRNALFANYIISDTGSYIYDQEKEKAIFKNPISKDTVKPLLAYYNDDFEYLDICSKDMIYKYSDKKEESTLIKTIKDKDYILNHCEEVSHIVISMKNNDNVTVLYNQLLQDFPNLNIMIMQDSFTTRKWLEINAKDCTKYNAIKSLADYLNISNSSIIAFGDGLNDIEMLEKCGIGVALQNALPEVKEASDDITTFDHNHDGVINYLKEHLNVE